MISLLWLLACGPDAAMEGVVPGGDADADTDVDADTDTDDGGDDTATADAPALESLDGPRLLRRLSIDLRGRLPTLEELETVEDDPDQLEVYRDAWLAEPELAERIVPLLAERWATLVDGMPAEYYEYGYELSDRHSWMRSIGQEPLRLIAHVVTEDLPWTEVVLADYTLANEYLAPNWPMEGYDLDSGGWQVVTYTDARPAGGVLVANGLWWRYQTSSFNENRARAEAISRLLVCEDLLLRPVSFAARDDLLDETETVDMVRSDPACLACHSVIEPLSAALFGFWTVSDHGGVEAERYHPEREILGPEALQVGAAWWGQPISGLSELGGAVAADPRFVECGVETFTELLLRRDLALEDMPLRLELLEVFEDNDLRVQALLRAITDSDEYRAGAVVDLDDTGRLDREVSLRAMTPSLLDSVFGHLTGWRWSQNGTWMLDDDLVGYRVLAGGSDGRNVTELQPDPTLTSLLVIERLAQASVYHAGTLAWDEEPASGPLAGLPLDPDEAQLTEIIDDLHFQLLARRASAEEVADLVGLWQEIAAMELAVDPAQNAWKAIWTVLLRDPEFVSY